MDREAVRARCLALSGATESLQWGDDLVFKIGGKMFAVIDLRPDGQSLSFKCPPHRFHEWLERAGVRPAPYLARAQWVLVDEPNDLTWAELSGALAEAYAQILSQLPKKTQRSVALATATDARRDAAASNAVPKVKAKAKAKVKAKVQAKASTPKGKPKSVAGAPAGKRPAGKRVGPKPGASAVHASGARAGKRRAR
ncbi:MAG: hypothetical protein NVS3B10_28660 [Polyangiales bacterium]